MARLGIPAPLGRGGCQLPSEDPEEPGWPDEYHYLQPHLLNRTLSLTLWWKKSRPS